MQKNLYLVQQLTVKYHFYFWTLSDRNMKMGCHVIFFLQILNLVPRVYTILDKTHSFHGVSGNSPENLRKLSVYEKFYDPGNHTKKQAFYVVNGWKPLSIFFSIWVFFHNHSRITGLQREGGGYSFNSSLPLPSASQTLRH